MSCADQFINILSNTDNVNQRAIIIKLVSNDDIRTCIEEVMSSVPIESQALFNKLPIKWEDCVHPYAVDEHAYRLGVVHFSILQALEILIFSY
jgi:hypothetical protein